MTLNEMIALLEAKRDEMGGDKEVLITTSSLAASNTDLIRSGIISFSDVICE